MRLLSRKKINQTDWMSLIYENKLNKDIYSLGQANHVYATLLLLILASQIDLNVHNQKLNKGFKNID